jgi:hypothetical protein
MNRAYISCDYSERNQQKIQELLSFLANNGVIVEYAPNPGWDYENITAAIERCDVFVAIFLDGYRDSAWLNTEFTYAMRVRETRESLHGSVIPRPRIFGWKLSEPPNYVNNQRLEWLSDDKNTWAALLKPSSKRELENKFFDEAVQKIRAKGSNS